VRERAGAVTRPLIVAPSGGVALDPMIVAPSGGVALDPMLVRRVPAVALVGGVVAAHGSLAALRARYPDAEPIVHGVLAVPGFRDPHVHLLRLASARTAIDCAPAATPDVPSLLARLRAASARLLGDGWLRAAGYDHLGLAERRHPRRDELDRAVPDRPLVLRHRSGHATMLNSLGLRTLGLESDRARAREDAVLHRDAGGRPTGLVIDGDALLRARGLPLLGRAALADAVSGASAELARAGVTWLCDAGADNEGSTRELFEQLAADGHLAQRWAMLQGLRPFLAGGGRANQKFAGVKVVPHDGPGGAATEPVELERQLTAVHEANMRAVVHAVEPEALVVVLTAFERLFARVGRGVAGHRIEHASVCPPALAAWIARLGLIVVTQPAFVEAFGDQYLRAGEVPADWLYACRTLRRAGVPVAAGSDAPCGPVGPLTALRTAVRRRSSGGQEVGSAQRLALGEALTLQAEATRIAGEPDGLRPGQPADVVILDRDLVTLTPDEIDDDLVKTTIAGGRVIFTR
jgi:predicted amidohydrolase YtcJ